MHIPRFFCPDPPEPGAPFALPPPAAHHAVRVLRLAVGAAVQLFDGSGAEYPAVLARVEREQVWLTVGDVRHPVVESPLLLTLGQGLSAADKFDFVLQKAVELGVAAVAPLAMRRSVVKLDAERAARRHQHWQGILRAAAEQCGRVRVPELAPLSSLERWVADLPGQGLRLWLSPEARQGVADLRPPPAGVILVVGPEGGFDPAEAALLQSAGFQAVRLGPRILRTETAALAALAALQSWHGDFGTAAPIIGA